MMDDDDDDDHDVQIGQASLSLTEVEVNGPPTEPRWVPVFDADPDQAEGEVLISLQLLSEV